MKTLLLLLALQSFTGSASGATTTDSFSAMVRYQPTWGPAFYGAAQIEIVHPQTYFSIWKITITPEVLTDWVKAGEVKVPFTEGYPQRGWIRFSNLDKFDLLIIPCDPQIREYWRAVSRGTLLQFRSRISVEVAEEAVVITIW